MPYLKSVNITFHTHEGTSPMYPGGGVGTGNELVGKRPETVVHVFVKNRLSNSLTPEQDADFISNLLASQRYAATGDLNDGDRNPYLAFGIGLVSNQAFLPDSSNSFDLTLRSDHISADEIVLPTVNISILTDGVENWIFDYTIVFTFDQFADAPTAASFTFSSAESGIPGIILDQNNRNFSGICAENPIRTRPLPAVVKPNTDAVLTGITLDFATRHENTDAETKINVHIANRLSASSFPRSCHCVRHTERTRFQQTRRLRWLTRSSVGPPVNWRRPVFGWQTLSCRRQYIIIAPNADDRWQFDFRVTYQFTDPQGYGPAQVLLLTDQRRDSGPGQPEVRGHLPRHAFPHCCPEDRPEAQSVDDRPHRRSESDTPHAMRQKFDEFINDRNGADTSQNPPLVRIRLHNAGKYNDSAEPESYVDQRSITALCKAANSIGYVSSPRSIGQEDGLYFNEVNSDRLRLNVDPAQPAPFTFTIDFDVSGSHETLGDHDEDFQQFSITLKLTLDLLRNVDEFDTETTVVDLMSWVSEIQNMLPRKQSPVRPT